MTGERSVLDNLRDWVDRHYLSTLPYVLICSTADERVVRRVLAENMISTEERKVEGTQEVRVVPSDICEAGKMMIINPYAFQNPNPFTHPAARTPGSPYEPGPYPPPA